MDKKPITGIKDSGERRVHSTGAMRDRSRGKGRLDLCSPFGEMFLSRIMEDGALKYADRNWEKGLPLSWYVDSALRHLGKYRAGMRDEPHLSQALWNIHCALHIAAQIHLEQLPKELMDLPNYFSEEPAPVLTPHEIESLMTFIGKPLERKEAVKLVEKLFDPTLHTQRQVGGSDFGPEDYRFHCNLDYVTRENRKWKSAMGPGGKISQNLHDLLRKISGFSPYRLGMAVLSVYNDHKSRGLLGVRKTKVTDTDTVYREILAKCQFGV